MHEAYTACRPVVQAGGSIPEALSAACQMPNLSLMTVLWSRCGQSAGSLLVLW